jgi:hypothetical protein
MKTEDLHTAADIKRVRELLVKEQNGLCAISGVKLEQGKIHLDHLHDNQQLVRGAAHHQANMMLGKLENLSTRYLYWYPHGLPAFLRACADYLEKEPDKRFRHTGWKKKAMVLFNKLSSKQQDYLLQCLDQPKGKNLVERKANFQKAVLSREFTYERLYVLIEQLMKG